PWTADTLFLIRQSVGCTARSIARMYIDDGISSIQFFPDRSEFRISKPQLAVLCRDAEAVSLQHISGVFDFFEAAVDVRHGQRSEQTESPEVITCELCAKIVQLPRGCSTLHWPGKTNTCCNAIPIHFGDGFFGSPGFRAAATGARRRTNVMVNIDQPFPER